MSSKQGQLAISTVSMCSSNSNDQTNNTLQYLSIQYESTNIYTLYANKQVNLQMMPSVNYEGRIHHKKADSSDIQLPLAR